MCFDHCRSLSLLCCNVHVGSLTICARSFSCPQEYFFAQDFEMTKRFFERVAKTYQKEGWYTMMAHIQRCLRVCAQQLGLLHEFVSASVALLSARLSSPT